MTRNLRQAAGKGTVTTQNSVCMWNLRNASSDDSNRDLPILQEELRHHLTTDKHFRSELLLAHK